jgi:hypothetical protein
MQGLNLQLGTILCETPCIVCFLIKEPVDLGLQI